MTGLPAIPDSATHSTGATGSCPRLVPHGFAPRTTKGLRALILALMLIRASTGETQESGGQSEPLETETEAGEPGDRAAAEDPCELPPDRELLGLDWTRRALFDTVCTSAMWLDGFFGDIRYDEAASGVRGRISYGIERREDLGVTTKPRFRVRIPMPNLNNRLSIYVEREDETRSIEGRSVEDQQAVEPVSTTPSQDSTQVGFAYRKLKLFDEVVEFRLGLRAPQGKLDYYGRVRYRHPFWRTDSTQWRFGQTLFWRHSQGWGETTQLDFEARLSEQYLFRWYNSATWSQVTEGVDWNAGFPLYRIFSGGRVVVVEPNLNGQTGLPHAVTSYGVRSAYRQTLGRPWLFGEIYVGEDWVKAPGERDSQFFTGLILEVVFDGRQRLPQPEQAPSVFEPLAPGESSPVR